MYLVSSCLAGINCCYDGENNFNKKAADLVKTGKAIPVCPEVLGGLSTPRIPSEVIINQQGKRKVINKKGEDVTAEFKLGAKKTLKIAQVVEAEKVILKQRSPSCGLNEIYDGTFSGNLIKKSGITAKLLIENGFEVLTEDDLND